MKFTEITIERNYTLNLGNYESARFGGAVTVHLNDDDDHEQSYNTAAEFLEDKLASDMEAFSEGEDDEKS